MARLDVHDQVLKSILDKIIINPTASKKAPSSSFNTKLDKILKARNKLMSLQDKG